MEQEVETLRNVTLYEHKEEEKIYYPMDERFYEYPSEDRDYIEEYYRAFFAEN